MSPVYWCWSNLRGSFKRIWQNIRWGWNESDVWSLDHTIAKFVLPRLKYLKKIKSGCPCVEGFEMIFSENGGTEEDDKRLHKAWDEILDKMIFSFDCIANHDYEDDLMDKICITKIDGWTQEDIKKNNSEELINKSKEEWKEFMEQSKIRRKEIQEGLDLFAKYYSGLWD